jgi:hypothetical protein
MYTTTHSIHEVRQLSHSVINKPSECLLYIEVKEKQTRLTREQKASERACENWGYLLPYIIRGVSAALSGTTC